MSQAKRKHINTEPVSSISRYPRKAINFSCRKNREIADYLDKQFHFYAKKWAEETEHLSSTSQIKRNANFIALSKLGKPIIPLILRQIIRGNSEPQWAILISEIVGYNPTPAEFSGNFDLMHGYWVKWGQEKGYI